MGRIFALFLQYTMTNLFKDSKIKIKTCKTNDIETKLISYFYFIKCDSVLQKIKFIYCHI